MKFRYSGYSSLLALSLCLSSGAFLAAQSNNSSALAVKGGTVSFVAKTNLSAIAIHGKSSALTAKASMSKDNEGLAISGIDARLPIATLETGMGLRDEHMRKMIFTKSDGTIADLRFEATELKCPKSSKSLEYQCPVRGKLFVRDVARPFQLDLLVREQPDGNRFKASGSGLVKLSDYGIERPSQLGVTVEDAVELKLELTGNRESTVSDNRRSK